MSYFLKPFNLKSATNLFRAYPKKYLGLIKILNKKYYFSPSYKLEEKWNERFEDEFVKKIKPGDFYYDLSKKYRKEGKVSAVDIDLFFHSIHTDEVSSYIEEIEEILRLLRRSPETINTLSSTPHCIIRNLLASKCYNLLLKFVSDPQNYGIFLEPYLANLLMNEFIIEKKFTAAARIAASLMLQEDYGPPLTQHLVLLSCFQYLFNLENNEEWVDYNPFNEPVEEVKVLVKYIRNPYFDDHFDIKDPLLIVGKTLAWLSPHLNEPFKVNAQLLGWSTYKKWDKLELVLNDAIKNSTTQNLDEKVFSITSSNVEEKCEDADVKSKLSSLLSQVKNSLTLSSIIDKTEIHVKELVNKYEKKDIDNQSKVYGQYIEERREAISKQLELLERKRLLEEIKTKKQQLKEKEEVLFFFDNEDKIEMELFRKRQLYPPEDLEKEKLKKEEEEYIPPEVKKKHT